MKRVIIHSGHPLFGRGVESLLKQETGLEIVARETDAGRLLERIRELRPDVVVVDGPDPASEPMPVVMRILRESVGTRVIALDPECNTMCVYVGDQREIKEVSDLVDAIRQRAVA